MPENTGRTPRKSAGRGSYAVGDARRQKILDTAVDHFGQWGFHASSLARIAHDCGITQGGLLHHFRSKEDLLLSVLAQSEQHDEESLFSVDPDSYADCLDTLVARDRRRAPVSRQGTSRPARCPSAPREATATASAASSSRKGRPTEAYGQVASRDTASASSTPAAGHSADGAAETRRWRSGERGTDPHSSVVPRRRSRPPSSSRPRARGARRAARRSRAAVPSRPSNGSATAAPCRTSPPAR
ncbi:hypothetical protein STANM309S_02369 [Streptomyces tanashiensis]